MKIKRRTSTVPWSLPVATNLPVEENLTKWICCPTTLNLVRLCVVLLPSKKGAISRAILPGNRNVLLINIGALCPFSTLTPSMHRARPKTKGILNLDVTLDPVYAYAYLFEPASPWTHCRVLPISPWRRNWANKLNRFVWSNEEVRPANLYYKTVKYHTWTTMLNSISNIHGYGQRRLGI